MNLPNKQKGLISDLFNITSVAASRNGVVAEIPIDDISSRQQIRSVFADLEGLAESLREEGQISPINVSRSTTDPNKYVIEQGERRWRAAKLAGLKTIKAIVIDAPKTDVDRTVQQLTENLQRDNMRPHEIADSFRKLNESGLTNAEIGRRLGWSRQRVQVYAGLINMHPRAEALAKEGQITDATTLQLVSRIYKAIGEEAADAKLNEYRDEAGNITLPRRQALRILGEVDPEHATSKNKKLSAKPARKAKETEEPDSAKDNENLSKVKDDASVQEPVEQPAPALTASAIVMSVQVRQHDIYGKTVEREGRLLLDKRAKEGDHVVVRFNDQREEEVPCRSVTILSVETE